MRYALFFVWLAITASLLFMAISDYAFNDETDPKAAAKLCAIRIGLAIVWPLAVWSSKGRQLLLQKTERI